MTQRYQDQRELAFTCWKKILEINLKFTSPDKLNRALDCTSDNLNILRGLGLPCNAWNFVFSYHFYPNYIRKRGAHMNENISIQNYQSTTTYLYTKCEVLVRDAIFSPWDRLETLVIMVKRSLMFRQNQIVIHQNPRTQCFFLAQKKKSKSTPRTPQSASSKSSLKSSSSANPIVKYSF